MDLLAKVAAAAGGQHPGWCQECALPRMIKLSMHRDYNIRVVRPHPHLHAGHLCRAVAAWLCPLHCVLALHATRCSLWHALFSPSPGQAPFSLSPRRARPPSVAAACRVRAGRAGRVPA